MRFLHIADLHIGKQFNDISLMEDQKYILDQIAGIAAGEKADVVLIAGDIYQKASPQAEAMSLFNDFVTRLAREKRKVFLISGNHDSDRRIAYFSSLIRGAGVYAGERFDGTLQRVSLSDEYGEIDVSLLPFLRPAQVRGFYSEQKIETAQDAVLAALKATPVDPKRRNVLLCHQFVTGAERSDSEEITIGGLDGVDAALFNDYDYVALGHIHKPQKLLRESIRYAGSPLKYSFSEANHRKSVALIELREKGEFSIRTIPLEPLRETRIVEGSIDEILQMPYSEDYVSVIVRDEIVPPDIRLTISANVFPNMMKFTVENSKTKQTEDVGMRERVEMRSVEALFTDFYRMQNNGVEPTRAHLDVLQCARREAEEEA